MNSPDTALATGSRVSIRGEEWLIRRTSAGTAILSTVGLSPLVEGKEARFLKDIETGITVIDPRRTKAVADPSPHHAVSRLLLESHIRSSTPESTSLHLGHRGAMDLLPYQLDPSIQALSQPRHRILIADAVGLGKTIECGVLLSELIKRGRGRRILAVTVKAMLSQFQKELVPASPFPSPVSFPLGSSGSAAESRRITTHSTTTTRRSSRSTLSSKMGNISRTWKRHGGTSS